jgi:hypothetical protein
MGKCTLAHDFKWETEQGEIWTVDIFRCSRCKAEPQNVKPNLIQRVRCFFAGHDGIQSDAYYYNCKHCGRAWWYDEIPFSITDIPRRLNDFWWNVRRVLNIHNWPAPFHRCVDCGKPDRVLFIHTGNHEDCWNIPF